MSELSNTVYPSLRIDGLTSKATEIFITLTAGYIFPNCKVKTSIFAALLPFMRATHRHLSDVPTNTLTELKLERDSSLISVTKDNTEHIVIMVNCHILSVVALLCHKNGI